jgi:uncharacterized membrane protein YqiK
MKVAEQQKLATEKELDVVKTQQVKRQEIEKERAVVQALQEKEVEEINKVQQRLKGEGARAFLEEQAKGMAAKVKEEGLAEAAALEAKQKALDKYTDSTIKALVAKDVVEMNRQVGLKSAEALANSDMRIFVGSDGGNFDMAKAVESIRVGSSQTASSLLNNMARQFDLGATPLKDAIGEANIGKKIKA